MVAVAVWPAGCSVAAGLARVHSVLDSVDPAVALATGDLGSTLRAIDRAQNRLAALKLAVVAEADRRNVAAGTGQSGTSAWLAGQTRTPGAAASGQVALAAALDAGLPATREALAEGAVSPQHAAVIAAATRALPDTLTPDEVGRVEQSLVRDARRLDPARLRTAARRALAAAERSAAEVDAAEDAALRSEEDAAWEASRLTLHDNGDGTVTGRFTVPSLAGAILRKVIQQLASPRRTGVCGPDAVRAGRTDPRARLETDSAAGETRPVDWASIDWAQRQGQAFVQLLEHLPTDRLAGKVAATVVVTVDHDRLRSSLGAAHLDTGTDLSASQARRLACQAGILPAVLSGDSLPLDVGRTERFFTEHQRTALATVYDACAVEGCDRPYAWTDLHHADPWARGGRSDLQRAVPVCGWHHRRLHDPRYHHTVETGPRGRKTLSLRLRTETTTRARRVRP